jgi:hypothetical protein
MRQPERPNHGVNCFVCGSAQPDAPITLSVRLSGGGAPVTFTASKLFIAYPQTLGALTSITKLDDRETEAFRTV